MGPGRVHILLGLDTGLRETEASFFHVGKWSEDVLLDHLNDLVQIWNDQADDVFLVLEQLLQLVDRLKSVRLALDVLGLIFVVKILHAKLKFLQKRLLGVLVCSWTSCPRALRRCSSSA